MQGSVAVLGSLNVDVVFTCEEFPQPGETLLCDSVAKGAGGKGLNQAVASAKAGSSTTLYGALGHDSDAELLLDCLLQNGVITDAIARADGASTGLAHIMVDRAGENSIIVASGANMAPSLDRAMFSQAKASVFLAQLEMAPNLVRAFFLQAEECGATRILNAAPALASARNIFPHCDVIIVNEHELAYFCDRDSAQMTQQDIEDGGRSLLSRDDQTILVTLGSKGVLHLTLHSAHHHAATKVETVDTTGAGDCFCGVFAASLASELSVSQAIERAARAAALAVTRQGAAASMPTASEIDG